MNIVNIASEAQVQVEASIQPKANMSRDSMSENLDTAPENTIAKLVLLTENRSTKISTLDWTMAGMLSVQKMQFNSLRPETFQMFPAVTYRKGNITRNSNAEVVAPGKDVAGGATEKFYGTEVSVPLEYGNGKENPEDEKNLRIDCNLPGSSFGGLDLSKLDLSSQGHMDHIVMPLVGLLMAVPLQILTVLLSHPPIKGDRGHTEIHKDRLDGGITDILLEQKKPFHVVQVKSRSLDVEEHGSRTKSSDEKSETEVNVELIRKNTVTKDFDVKRYGVRLPRNTEIGVHNPVDGCCQVGKVTHGNDGAHSFPLILLDEPDTQHSQPLIRCHSHSLLKISYSDGSLSNPLGTSDSENVTIDIDLDELDLFNSSPGQSGSALSKLRVKMANMTLPVMAMPENRQKQLKEQARNNRLRSQLRFRELKTRIILL